MFDLAVVVHLTAPYWKDPTTRQEAWLLTLAAVVSMLLRSRVLVEYSHSLNTFNSALEARDADAFYGAARSMGLLIVAACALGTLSDGVLAMPSCAGGDF